MHVGNEREEGSGGEGRAQLLQSKEGTKYWWKRIDSNKIGSGGDGPGITIRRWKQSLRDDL